MIEVINQCLLIEFEILLYYFLLWYLKRHQNNNKKDCFDKTILLKMLINIKKRHNLFCNNNQLKNEKGEKWEDKKKKDICIGLAFSSSAHIFG